MSSLKLIQKLAQCRESQERVTEAVKAFLDVVYVCTVNIDRVAMVEGDMGVEVAHYREQMEAAIDQLMSFNKKTYSACEEQTTVLKEQTDRIYKEWEADH